MAPSFQPVVPWPSGADDRASLLRAWRSGSREAMPEIVAHWALEPERTPGIVASFLDAVPNALAERMARALVDAPLIDVACVRLFTAMDALAALDPTQPELSRWVLAATCSPIQLRYMQRHPDAIQAPEQAIAKCLASLRASVADAESPEAQATMTAALRVLKRLRWMALLEADWSAPWAVASHAGAISRFAEEAVALALDFAQRKHGVTGLAVFGMGKLGSCELNWSSDVDLVFVHAPGAQDQDRVDRIGRVVRTVAEVLDEQTDLGRVFRVDLLLRPFGSQGALSHTPAELRQYAEAHAREWERTAWLKARVIAGDAAVADAALAGIEAFRFPRSIDGSRLAELASAKQAMIAAARANAQRSGVDLKHGRGGIRELEFFVQTYQLVFGGRDPALRQGATPDVIRHLVARGDLSEADADALIRAWRWLRLVEHRVQMEEERQTHTLPTMGEAGRSIALRLGYADSQALVAAADEVMADVVRITGPLLSGDASTQGGDWLVAALRAEDDVAADLLSEAGFLRAHHVVAELRRAQGGRSPVVGRHASAASDRAAQALLAACAGTPLPDRAIHHAFSVLQRKPCRDVLLPAIAARPAAARVTASLFAAAQELSTVVTRHPLLLESLLAPPRWLGRSPSELGDGLQGFIDRAEPIGDQLPQEARAGAIGRFRLEVEASTLMARVAGVADLWELCRITSATASAVVEAVTREAFAQLGARAASATVDRLAIVAFGKLGRGALGPGGDLDLVFVYDDAPVTVGVYAKVVQRIVSALTTSSAYGRLYPVDLRLRPDGSQGAVVTSVVGFEEYYAVRARPYECLATTSAAVIGGGPELRQRLEQALDGVARRSDWDAVARDIADLRARRLADVSDDDFKGRPAGLLDLEVSLQLLAARASLPVAQPPRSLVDALASHGDLVSLVADDVVDALAVYRGAEIWTRLSEGADRSHWPEATHVRRSVEARIERDHERAFTPLWQQATETTEKLLTLAGLVGI